MQYGTLISSLSALSLSPCCDQDEPSGPFGRGHSVTLLFLDCYLFSDIEHGGLTGQALIPSLRGPKGCASTHGHIGGDHDDIGVRTTEVSQWGRSQVEGQRPRVSWKQKLQIRSKEACTSAYLLRVVSFGEIVVEH